MELQEHELAMMVSDMYDNLVYRAPGSLHGPNRQSNLRARLGQVKNQEPELEHGDGLRKSAHASMHLKGKPQLTAKQEQDRVATCGLRRPRFSVQKVPGHREVGSRVAEATDNFLDDHHYMESKLLGALGNAQGTST